MQKPIRTIVSMAVVMMASTVANAGSFSLYTESSAAEIGNYAAGAAAEAANASTGWYNPAGLSLIHSKQGVFGIVGVAPSAKLRGFSTFSTVGVPSYTQSFNDLSGGKMGYVPSAHLALPVGENTTLGLSLVSPFGLSTQWSRIGPVRYEATTSNFITSNISPEIGSRINEHFAVGAGIDLQYARVRFNRVVGSPAQMMALGAPPRTLDSLSYNKGHSFGVGFHAGAMALFDENHTRIGVNYQSQVRHSFHGYSRLQGRLAALPPVATPSSILRADPNAIFWSYDLASNNINLPEVATLSGYRDLNDRLALLGSVVFTGWKSLKTIELDRVGAYAPNVGQVVVNSSSTQDYRNAWRFALGANYHVNEKLMMRIGGGYDQTPTRNKYRDVRIPDSDRWAASVGAHYQVQPSIGVDIGYTHLFSVGEAKINRTDVAGSTSEYFVHAKIKAHADLVGLQAVWTLDQPAPVPTK
ncbi:47 kDa outer membrane protein precursor [Legionella massiliensis]|uniref:47 kDa outer membrane protein n=2 Tax=Legionella massiliensis TaxID=1034943 RepID=A0A078KZV3_9GAMM|nr:47 kDa outer membrane protein precursor [Legionella massiliensis]CEE14270.1 47 kDa outer membrane protein precursor [Legionella massiliensis]